MVFEYPMLFQAKRCLRVYLQKLCILNHCFTYTIVLFFGGPKFFAGIWLVYFPISFHPMLSNYPSYAATKILSLQTHVGLDYHDCVTTLGKFVVL